MERANELRETSLVDLGSVAEQTRGGSFQPILDGIGNQQAGLSDD